MSLFSVGVTKHVRNRRRPEQADHSHHSSSAPSQWEDMEGTRDREREEVDE